MIAAIVIASILGYAFGAGVTREVLAHVDDEMTRDVVTREVLAHVDDEMTRDVATVFWPLALPAILGTRLVRRLRAPKRHELPTARVAGRTPGGKP